MCANLTDCFISEFDSNYSPSLYVLMGSLTVLLSHNTHYKLWVPENLEIFTLPVLILTSFLSITDALKEV